MNSHILMFLGLWILNGIIGIQASQYSEPQTAKKIIKSNKNTKPDPPLIKPQQPSIELDLNSKFTLSCKDTEPIAWNYPNKGDVTESPFLTHDKKRRYGRLLTLANANFYNSGPYYCLRTKNLTTDISLLNYPEIANLITNNMGSRIVIMVGVLQFKLAENLSSRTNETYFRNENITTDGPVIKPQQRKIEVKVNSKLYLKCDDTEVIAWKFPNMSNSLQGPYLSRDIKRFYGKMLTQSNVSSYSTGNYYCVRLRDLKKDISLLDDSELTDLVNNHTAAVIYVWVNEVIILPDGISSDSQHYTTDGGIFNLRCNFRKLTGVKYKIKWILPRGLQWNETRMSVTSKDYEESPTNFSNSSAYTQFRSNLTVSEARTDDTGEYTCNISDELSQNSSSTSNATYQMWIVHKEEYYIEIEESNNNYEINEKFNKTMQMTIRYSGYPWPTLKWHNPNGVEISNNHKFEIINEGVISTLKIYKTRLRDTGIYTVEAINPFKTERRHFNVTITDFPIVVVENVRVDSDAEIAHVQCKVQSYDKAVVRWEFEACSIKPRWPSCSGELIRDLHNTSSSNGNTTMDFIYDLYFVPKSSGKIRCIVENKIGTTIAESLVLIRDISDNITIYGITNQDIIALDDPVTITCAALGYYYTNDINWYEANGGLIQPTEDIAITESSSPYSFRKSLTFKKIKYSNQGRYECRARAIKDETTESRIINITTHEPQPPRMTTTNLGDDHQMKHKLGETIELICESESIPKAITKWYKNNKLISNEGITLSVPYLKPEDEGQYKCVVTNRLGSIEKSVKIKITNMPTLSVIWIVGILLIFIISISLVIYFYSKVKRERTIFSELNAVGLSNFEDGNVDHINPDLTLNEQADLLPYDRCFEFSRDKLKLGKQLGAGAFGVVLKAQASGIMPEEHETTVAVKMVNRQANNEVMKALVSELKIMIHLGKHLNVVNLLGAVTRNIVKRELMVIVEYCPYGNIRNFLIYNQKRFVNQINPSTGKIDPSITIETFSDNLELNRFSNMTSRYSMNNRTDSNSSGYVTQSEKLEGQLNDYTTDLILKTTIAEEDDKNILPKSHDFVDFMTVSTTDLISWAFQISFGMEYLSSKNVLHGDLAARNILLCEDNIVKICDFGLSRSMYESEYYRKQADALLPIKWLALESFSDHIFSTSTDVWSFGIVMWEIFSLGKVPYPKMSANQSLYLKLRDGYRMEKPAYANDDLYDTMLECWSANPERRPLFKELKNRFAVMLDEEVTNNFVNLNDIYVKVNRDCMKASQKDYPLMDSPEMTAHQEPRYERILSNGA